MTMTAGFTLVELIVTLAILGVLLGLSGLSAPPRAPASRDGWQSATMSARREALRSGRSVVVREVSVSLIRMAVALPDGRVITDSIRP